MLLLKMQNRKISIIFFLIPIVKTYSAKKLRTRCVTLSKGIFLSCTLLLAVILLAGCNRDGANLQTPFNVETADSLKSGKAIAYDSTAHYLDAFLQADATVNSNDASGQAVREGLLQFYQKGEFKPAWLNGLKLSDHALSLINDVCTASNNSLLPVSYQPEALYDALEQAAMDPTHEKLATLDLQLSRTFMLYADDHIAGRLDPEVLPYEVYLKRDEAPLAPMMAVALNRPAPESFSNAMRPVHPHYSRLLDALERYRAIEENGGWPSIKIDETLKPGMSDTAVTLLRTRLHRSGDLSKNRDSTNTLFDENVATAVAQFQVRHGLAVDSLLGPATLAALNVPVTERVRQIERSIERWRWLPQDLGDRYVLVNIPAFKVFGYQNGQQALEMRVIVGSEFNEQYTPVFRDKMEYVVFRPYWNVPAGIAAEEIAPKAMDDPTYISRNNYEILDGEDIVTPNEEAIEKLIEGKYRIRQQGGPTNALGLVKFIFPNQHAIYLHDTPADHLFDRTERDMSHGCIRLEDPAKFAAYVLGPQGWSSRRIKKALAAEERTEVQLEESIPVYLMYLTAYADADDNVFFFDDVYGFDRDLKNALDRREQRLLSTSDNTKRLCDVLEKFEALG